GLLPAPLRSDTCVTVLPFVVLGAAPAVAGPRRLVLRAVCGHAARSGDERAEAVRGFRRRVGDPAAHPFEDVLADQVAGRQLDRVLPIETRPTQPGLRLLG